MDPSPNGTRRTPNEEDLWRLLSHAISLRSTQDLVLWSIFGTFWASSAILIVALGGTLSPPSPGPGLVVAGVGAGVGVAWALSQRRALHHLERDEDLMAKFEDALGLDLDFAVSWRLNSAAYDKRLKGRWWPKARQVMSFSPLAVVVFWLAAAVYFAGVAAGVVPTTGG